MDSLKSMYIDNELSLDEKIYFVELVHEDRDYKDDAVSLIRQEKLLRATIPTTVPDVQFPALRREKSWSFPRTATGIAAAACLLVILFVPFWYYRSSEIPSGPETASHLHRFILYQTDTRQVEISGSFTDWKRIPLHPVGSGGYWEISLNVPPGEHRYTFILDGSRPLPDPTVLAHESDDFGAANSILVVGAS